MNNHGNTEVIPKFPTMDEALSLVPPGRLPYMQVRDALMERQAVVKNVMTTLAIRALAEAQREDKLDPPLDSELANTISVIAAHIDENGHNISRDFNYDVTDMVLQAAFECGYRSDSA